MSDLLRRAIDIFLGLDEENPRVMEVLRDLNLDDLHLAKLDGIRRTVDSDSDSG